MPDFFIVGHQKCGTTALYVMLRSHPQIFMSEVKEPQFFASDLRSSFGRPSAQRPHTLDGYLSLFAAAGPQQRVGDASPQYLRSHAAAGAIAEVRPDARIVAVLREPASFLRSFHLQMVSSGVETQKDFRKALALEELRREGKRIPRLCHRPESLMYSQHVRYAEQLRRFHGAFPAENVLVLIYDDFRRDNEATVRRVLRFLDVDDTLPIDAVQTGPVKAVRSQRLHQLTHAVRVADRNPDAVGPLARAVSTLTPRRLRGDAFWTFWSRALYGNVRPPDEGFMLELRRRFKPEVVALSDYLGRDLVSEWGYDGFG